MRVPAEHPVTRPLTQKTLFDRVSAVRMRTVVPTELHDLCRARNGHSVLTLRS